MYAVKYLNLHVITGVGRWNPLGDSGKTRPKLKSKQADSSLSKNQVPITLTTNDVTIKLREQGLDTKECVAMQTN